MRVLRAFESARLEYVLKQLFTRSRLIQLWRNLVRDQMRRFDITDLHDYYDFNFAIAARADAIIERILVGQYRAEVPLVYRSEKKLGICRHMMVPTPSDALVFQLLTDVLYNDVIKAQPNAILGDISEVLKSRGLALNLGKTEIMTKDEARKHFLFEENLRLNRFQRSARTLKTFKARQNLSRRIQLELSSHLRSSNARNKDKLTKRYLSVLGILGVPAALQLARKIYVDQPALRDTVLKYSRHRGSTDQRYQRIRRPRINR